MSLLDEDLYGDPDEFLERFGSDAPTLEQIRALQVCAHSWTCPASNLSRRRSFAQLLKV